MTEPKAFDGNKAEKGGAVYVQTSKAFLKTRFVKNTADFGGAVYVDGSCKDNGGTAKLDCEACEFHGNHAHQDGGAVYVDGGTANFQKNSFVGNSAKASCFFRIMSNSKLICKQQSGGAAFANGANVNFQSCTFKENYAGMYLNDVEGTVEFS